MCPSVCPLVLKQNRWKRRFQTEKWLWWYANSYRTHLTARPGFFLGGEGEGLCEVFLKLGLCGFFLAREQISSSIFLYVYFLLLIIPLWTSWLCLFFPNPSYHSHVASSLMLFWCSPGCSNESVSEGEWRVDWKVGDDSRCRPQVFTFSIVFSAFKASSLQPNLSYLMKYLDLGLWYGGLELPYFPVCNYPDRTQCSNLKNQVATPFCTVNRFLSSTLIFPFNLFLPPSFFRITRSSSIWPLANCFRFNSLLSWPLFLSQI